MSEERQTEILESLGTKTYTASFQRPNDVLQYAANDVVANSDSAPAINSIDTELGKRDSYIISNAKIRIDDGGNTNMAGFRLALYNEEPGTFVNDNSAFNLPAADRSKFLGYVDIDTPVDLGDTVYGQTANINHQLTLVDGIIYFQLITLGTETPVAQAVYNIFLDLISLKG